MCDITEGMDSNSQDRSFLSALIETVLAGGGLLLFLLWWNNRKDKTPEEKKDLNIIEETKQLQTEDEDLKDSNKCETDRQTSKTSPDKTGWVKNETVKVETSTQTEDTTIWKAVWVCGGSSDSSSNWYRSELHLDLSTGAITRSEKIDHKPLTSNIAVLA